MRRSPGIQGQTSGRSRSTPVHDGIINLLKPTGITSAKALYRVRSITGVRKSGHAGALDPAADGVLVLCLGRATKLVERIMDLSKVYRTTARLDVTSESFDSDRPLRDVRVDEIPDEEDVRRALSSFEGEISQVPPRISAIKIKGVPAYKTAGSADAPPMRPRPVRIYWTRLHAYDWPTVDFEVACGRGMYVRSLIRDIGSRLKTGGCLTSLRRAAVGPFTLENAWTFDRLESAPSLADYLIPFPVADRLITAARCASPTQDST